MRHSISELWNAFLAIIFITVAYALVSINLKEIPDSSDLFGHVLGIVGFVFMLMTQFLYSFRKDYERAAHWGRLESWLKFHIFTGLVGPYLVLLHTAWHFNGLAGVVTLITILIVMSGFGGRYIYTAIPRTAAGIELAGGDLESQIIATEAELQHWCFANSNISGLLPPTLFGLPQANHNAWSLLFGRRFIEWGYNWRWWAGTRAMKGIGREKLELLNTMLTRRRVMYYQIGNLVIARHVLAIWHSIHVPLCIVLFITAFIHIGAAIYFVTLAR